MRGIGYICKEFLLEKAVTVQVFKQCLPHEDQAEVFFGRNRAGSRGSEGDFK
jgi:hypothetical protein